MIIEPRNSLLVHGLRLGRLVFFLHERTRAVEHAASTETVEPVVHVWSVLRDDLLHKHCALSVFVVNDAESLATPSQKAKVNSIKVENEKKRAYFVEKSPGERTGMQNDLPLQEYSGSMAPPPVTDASIEFKCPSPEEIEHMKTPLYLQTPETFFEDEGGKLLVEGLLKLFVARKNVAGGEGASVEGAA